jgi:hypothetical protein
MRHAKLSAIGLTVVLAICVVAVASGSAEPEEIYRVNGATLEAGKQRPMIFKQKRKSSSKAKRKSLEQKSNGH